jgi:hypothetical protein
MELIADGQTPKASQRRGIVPSALDSHRKPSFDKSRCQRQTVLVPLADRFRGPG